MVSDDCARRGSTVRAWDLREQGRKPCRQLAFPFTHCTGRLSRLSGLFGWSGLFGLAGWFGQSGEDRLNRQDRLAAYPFAWNPIRWGLDSGALKSWRIVSKRLWIAWSCPSNLRSNSDSFCARRLFVASNSRSLTKARTTCVLISTARALLSTIAAIMAPCSVKAYDKVLLPPRPVFDLANCEVKAWSSSRVS
jgi:hypothetical protein